MTEGALSDRSARPAILSIALAILRDNAVIVYAFAASRLALLAIGLLTQITIRPLTAGGNILHLTDQEAINIWGAWDTGWYTSLVLNGYQAVPSADGQANWAFFPAFPTLARGLSSIAGLSPLAAMITVSNLCFLAALFLVHRLARSEYDRRTADLTVILLCVAPGSYIFSSAYTEGLFLLCITAGLLLIASRRWLVAGLAMALAVLTRNLGIGLLLPFGLAALPRLLSFVRPGTGERTPVPELLRIVAGGLAPLLALGGFMAFLYVRTGDALAFVHIQKAWLRSIGNPMSDLILGLIRPSLLVDGDLLSFAMAWIALGLLVALALSRRWSLFAFALFLTLISLATGVVSFARYALVILPLWMVAADFLSRRSGAAMACVITLAMFNGFMMVAWTLALRIAI